ADGTLRIWDTTAGTHSDLAGHNGAVRALAVMADDRVVSGGDDGAVCLWEASGDAHHRFGEDHTGPVRAVAVTDDGQIVSGGDDGTLRVWSTRPGPGWQCRVIPVGTPIRAVAAIKNMLVAVGHEGVLTLRVD